MAMAKYIFPRRPAPDLNRGVARFDAGNATNARQALFLGVDGGGTGCRARLCDASGVRLAEAAGGPANIRFGLNDALASVREATLACLAEARLTPDDLPRITACLALAGASEPSELAAARTHPQAFGKAILTTDAHAACIGAHNGHDGAVIIVGTGSIGWAVLHGRQHRVGGWGFEISDEGSGAWLGRETLRRVLAAHDGRSAWTPLLRTVFERYGADPHAIVSWVARASPRAFGALAPVVFEHASRNDAAAVELLRIAAAHIETIAVRLIELGVPRLALAGGLAPHIEGLLSVSIRERLVAPIGDALDGALQIAHAAAQSAAA
jgi:glucosamine kinase